jgi:hypothetical protein
MAIGLTSDVPLNRAAIMAKNLVIGIAIGASVVGMAWLILGNQRRFPGGDSDFAGSRSFSEPREVPDFSPEKNVLTPEVEKVLNSAQQFTLLSLDPEYLSDEVKARLGPDALFHEFRILGKAEIRDAVERAALARALLAGIADSNGMAAGCFDPRHGVRVTLDGATVDIVICFECMHIETYLNDKHVLVNGFVDALTSRLPRPLFNEALRKAGLPLARSMD